MPAQRKVKASPVVLAAGARLRMRVSFKPAQPGGVTGALQVRTNAANFHVFSLSLTGQGTNASLAEASFRAIGGQSVGVTVSYGLARRRADHSAERQRAARHRPAGLYRLDRDRN